MIIRFNLLICLAFIFICNIFIFAQDTKQDSPLIFNTNTPCGNPFAQSDGYLTSNEDKNVLVVKVIDGNTIIVELKDKTQKFFELGGLDVFNVETEEGKQSQQYLEKLLLNKRVDLLRHSGSYTGDPIGGEITPDAGRKMLEDGMARFKRSKFLTSYGNCQYEKVSEKAIVEGKGLWKNNR